MYAIKTEIRPVQIQTDAGSNAVQVLLMRWGNTRRINDAYHLAHPHETPFSRLARKPGSWSVKTAPLDPEFHAVIDSVISQLKTRNPMRHEIIWRSYVNGDSDSQIARELTPRLSRHEVKSWRRNAEGWIESRLDL